MTDLTYDELQDVVFDFFGTKATYPTILTDQKAMTLVLYESFFFLCGFEDEHGSFHGEIAVGPGLYQSDFFGSRLSRNPDRTSVLHSLQRVDEWCRKRLPADFVKAWQRGQDRR